MVSFIYYYFFNFGCGGYTFLQVTMKNPQLLQLSVSLPTPPPETAFSGGLPVGAIEAMKAAYGAIIQILDPPRDGFNLTLKLNLSKLPPNEGSRSSFSKVIPLFSCLFRNTYICGSHCDGWFLGWLTFLFQGTERIFW